MIAETSGSCTVVFTGDSTFLYLLVKWTVKRDSRIGKDAFIATNFVLVPITSALRVQCLKVPCLRVPGLRVSDLRSRVPGFRS